MKPKPDVNRDREFFLKCKDLAIELTLGVVDRYGFPKLESKKTTRIENASFSHYLSSTGEVILYADFDTRLGEVNMSLNLTRVTYDIVCIVGSLFSNNRGPRLLEDEIASQLATAGIDMRTLLKIDNDDELGASIRENCEWVLELFVTSLAFFAESSVIHSLDRSKLAWSLNYLRPVFSSYWSELGLPKGWSLISEKTIDELRKGDLHFRNWFLGERRRSELTDHQLLARADELLRRYRIFKTQYIRAKAAFFAGRRRATKKEWRRSWIHHARSEFPDLSAAAGAELMENEELNPFELRNIHLAHVYGYSREYLRKKLQRIRRRKRKLNG